MSEFEIAHDLASSAWISTALENEKLRANLPLVRLHDNPKDSIAWWSLTEGLAMGVGPGFTKLVYGKCQNSETWGETLLRLNALGFPNFAAHVVRKVEEIIAQTQNRLASLGEELKIWKINNPSTTWGDWLISEAQNSTWDAKLKGRELSEEVVRLLRLVGTAPDDDVSINKFLNDLEKWQRLGARFGWNPLDDYFAVQRPNGRHDYPCWA